MTREEAIETLGHVVPFATQNGEKIAEAIDMAIEALQTDADCSTCKHKDKGWDSEECDSCCGNNNHYEAEYIIPSGDVMFTSDVVRCKDCRHRYMDGEVTHYYWCKLHDRPVDDTDFCSWGEESEVEE